MYKLIFTASVVFLLAGCSGGKKPPVYNGRLSNDFLEGTWMITNSDFSNVRNASAQLKDSLDTRVMMHILRFDKDGKFLSDNGDIIPGNGTYDADGKGLKLKYSGGSNIYYSLERGTDSSMIFIIEKSNDALMENGKVSLKRINSALHDIGHPAWKQAPASPLADEEVRKKLKMMLQYYEHELRAMVEREIDVLAHRKILMPLKYYSVGIDMRKFEERVGWDVFFGDSAHARTAYNMLQKAYDDISLFPKRDNFFLLYADIFAMLAKNLDKAS